MYGLCLRLSLLDISIRNTVYIIELPMNYQIRKRRLSAREKLISGASPLMHVAREMTDPHGLGSLINPLPGGKSCAKRFLKCVDAAAKTIAFKTSFECVRA